MVMKGWELGVSESISIVIAVGLSVDYVLHLSTTYQHSSFSKRTEKMTQAYEEMGVSILSGTLTTLGTGIFLFGSEMSIFIKFGNIIIMTISLSFAVSMIFFGALCHTIGPENGKGDLTCFKVPKRF